MVIGFDKFLLIKQLKNIVFLVCFLHCLFDGFVGQDLITSEINFVNLNLIVLVDVYVNNHFVLFRKVFAKVNFYCRITKAFVVKVFLDDLNGTIDDVLGYLVPFH